MRQKNKFIVVLVTANTEVEANKIATTLLKQKLIACANIIPKVNSLFWWEGKIDKSSETFLVIKTKSSLLNEVVKSIKRIHSYEVPEIIAIPIIGGNKDYLKWIEGVTKRR
jgi:periplasmic divalent cation tolerance protein